MTYTRKNKGVCSLSTEVTLTDDGVIESVTVVGGCNGNLKGISAHGKRMVDIVLDEEYHRFLEQMYREEKINAFNLVDDIRQLSYEQIAKASRYVRALKNGFSE